MTGESEPQERCVDIANAGCVPLEASNLVFNGTTVVVGEGLGLVIRTGDGTFLGQIAGLTMQGERRASQLTREIDIFVKGLAVVAVTTGAIFFTFGLLRSTVSLGMSFSFAVGVFVGFVPEGLPLTVTALLTLSAQRMAKLNVLVKDLHSVETLGSITLLATDKTGTLTQNKMSVSELWINSQLHDVGDSIPLDTPNFNHLLHICALCTRVKATGPFNTVEMTDDIKPALPEVDSSLKSESKQSTPQPFHASPPEVLGDATEVGLYKFALGHGIEPTVLAEQHPIVFEIPFSSHTKWHLTVHRYEHAEGHFIAFLKGAPERVTVKCTRVFYQGALAGTPTLEWGPVAQAAFETAYASLAGQGRRVLGLASIALPGNLFPLKETVFKKEFFLTVAEFSFVGLVALMDPPKHGVRQAINSLRMAGIQVVMVTGDHPLTAQVRKFFPLISGYCT